MEGALRHFDESMSFPEKNDDMLNSTPPDKPPEPTPVGAGRFAFAVRVTAGGG
jgi:hypothetical protein